MAGCTVFTGDGLEEFDNGCIIAIQPLDAVQILGEQATFDELRILGSFQHLYWYTFVLSIAPLHISTCKAVISLATCWSLETYNLSTFSYLGKRVYAEVGLLIWSPS